MSFCHSDVTIHIHIFKPATKTKFSSLKTTCRLRRRRRTHQPLPNGGSGISQLLPLNTALVIDHIAKSIRREPITLLLQKLNNTHFFGSELLEREHKIQQTILKKKVSFLIPINTISLWSSVTSFSPPFFSSKVHIKKKQGFLLFHCSFTQHCSF